MLILKITLFTFLFIIILAVGAYLFMIFPCIYKPKNTDIFKNTHYAHRGLHDLAGGVPENTVLAFEKAISKGYGIEFDVRLTRDGKAVIMHDDSLKRMCGVDAKISEKSYDEIKDITIGNTNEKIPLFSEVLKKVDGSVPLLVELKNTGDNYAELSQKAFEHLDAYTGLYCVESFDPRVIGWLKKNRPKVYRGQLACHMSLKTSHGKKALLLRSLAANFISRPHFVAYSFKDSKKCFGFKLCRMLGADVFFWTLRDKNTARDALLEGGAIIFEGFEANSLK